MKKLSRTSVYMLLIGLFLLAVNICLGLVLIRQSSAAMRSLIESRMLDVANTAAALLDGDTLKTLQADDEGTPAYQNVYKMLTCFEDNIELEYIYCVRDLGGGEFVFMIDPDAVAPGEFGEHIPYTDALYQASLGAPGVDKVPYEDNWGRFYSAYSPVFDSEHGVAGIVAVDFSAEWYENQISQQLRTTLLLSGLSLLLGVVIAAMLVTNYRKRFRQALDEMNVVSDGIETLVHEVAPRILVRPKPEAEDLPAGDELAELGSRIRSLENQLSEQISLVRSQAYIDGLTGLANRTAYEDRVKQLEEEIENEAAAFSLAMFDLNGLKEINDLHGHQQGDRVITEAASVLREVFGNERLYRIGGDEFIAVLEGARRDAESLLTAVARRLAERSSVTAASGCAVFDPESDTGYRDVFKRADNAMYNDKKQYYLANGGRDRRKH